MEKDAKKIDKRLLRLIIASILVVASSSVGLIAGFKIASNNQRVVTVKDQSKFDEVINILASNDILPSKYTNHLLEPKKKRNMGMSCTARCIIRISKNR